MQTTNLTSAPHRTQAIGNRRQPDAFGYIRCSYCSHPVLFHPDWAQQQTCPSCGFKFPDFLQPPIASQVPIKPKPLPQRPQRPMSVYTLPAKSNQAVLRPTLITSTALAGRCPKCQCAQAHNVTCNACWMKANGTRDAGLNRKLKAIAPSLLWAGTAYGVVGLIAPQHMADHSMTPWIFTEAVGIFVFLFLTRGRK